MRYKKKSRIPAVFVVIIILISFLSGLVLGVWRGDLVAHNPQGIVYASEIGINAKIPMDPVAIPILVYHYVENVKDERDTIRKSLNILPEIFEEQLKTLKEAGYHFIFTKDIGRYLDGVGVLPTRPIVITFDDGYEDFYTDVFPILKREYVAATQYVISGSIGSPNYMNKTQLDEIVASGLVEIGAHSVSHPNLNSLTSESALQEINQSKIDLENKFGIKVVSFAYPYGSYNQDVVESVAKSGYSTAVTTIGGSEVTRNNRLLLFRIHPGIQTGEQLLNGLSVY